MFPPSIAEYLDLSKPLFDQPCEYLAVSLHRTIIAQQLATAALVSQTKSRRMKLARHNVAYLPQVSGLQ